MAHILIADDEESIRTILTRLLEKTGHHVFAASRGDEAHRLLLEQPIEVALLDLRMPGLSGLDLLKKRHDYPSQPVFIIMTAQDTMENAVETMKHGAYDYITKPFDLDEIIIQIDRAIETRELKKDLRQLTREHGEDPFHIVGKSKGVQEIFKTIGRVTDQDVTVLIQGESGTGKELVAKAIHYKGKRALGPFVAINCAAIPKGLIESELFGHKKGAYTGAERDKTGLFEQAHKGTLFLDEVGEIPLNLQGKLLRALQEREIQKLGEAKPIPIDVRIIAATNRDLTAQVKKGDFREDLFYRLNVVPMTIPSLRERSKDIPLLVEHFLQKSIHESLGLATSINKEALKLLESFPWPGNVREIENAIKRAVVLSQGAVLTPSDFSFLSQDGKNEASFSQKNVGQTLNQCVAALIARDGGEENLYDRLIPLFEKPLFEAVLEKTGFNQIKAAEKLGINRNTLRKKMKDLGIKRGKDDE